MGKPLVQWFAYWHKDKGVEITDECGDRLCYFSLQEDISPKSEKIKECASVIKSTPQTVSTAVSTMRRLADVQCHIQEKSDEQRNKTGDSKSGKSD